MKNTFIFFIGSLLFFSAATNAVTVKNIGPRDYTFQFVEAIDGNCVSYVSSLALLDIAKLEPGSAIAIGIGDPASNNENESIDRSHICIRFGQETYCTGNTCYGFIEKVVVNWNNTCEVFIKEKVHDEGEVILNGDC